MKDYLDLIEECMECFSESFMLRGHLFFDKNNRSMSDLNIRSHRADDERMFKTAVLEHTCRAAFKTEPYKASWRNNKLHMYMRDSLNAYLGTSFSEDDIEFIYTYIGNGINHKLALKFYDNGFDLEWLKEKMRNDNN